MSIEIPAFYTSVRVSTNIKMSIQLVSKKS